MRGEDFAAPVERVQRVVCRYFAISLPELVAARREPPIVTRRWIAIYLCRELTSKSLPQIGRAFGQKHTSVMYAIRQVERLRKENEFIATAVEEIRTMLEGE